MWEETPFPVSLIGLQSAGFPSVLHMYTTCLLSLSHPRAGQAYAQAETDIQHHNIHDMI